MQQSFTIIPQSTITLSSPRTWFIFSIQEDNTSMEQQMSPELTTSVTQQQRKETPSLVSCLETSTLNDFTGLQARCQEQISTFWQEGTFGQKGSTTDTAQATELAISKACMKVQLASASTIKPNTKQEWSLQTNQGITSQVNTASESRTCCLSTKRKASTTSRTSLFAPTTKICLQRSCWPSPISITSMLTTRGSGKLFPRTCKTTTRP